MIITHRRECSPLVKNLKEKYAEVRLQAYIVIQRPVARPVFILTTNDHLKTVVKQAIKLTSFPIYAIMCYKGF